jgi:hypothetical protein
MAAQRPFLGTLIFCGAGRTLPRPWSLRSARERSGRGVLRGAGLRRGAAVA